MLINREDIEAMPHLYRVAFINSLSGFKSANLVGSVDREGRTNLSIVSSCTHIGAHPPLVAMIIRPHSVERHTLENILATGHYTLNQVHEGIYRPSHQTSARYPKEVSEFTAVGLTEEWRDDFVAPFVKESKISLGMALREHHHLSINGTELVIGEILQVQLPSECLMQDGFVDIEKAETVALSGLDSYHRSQRLARLSYAKLDAPLQDLE
ncbi:flavin reductase [Hahella sp. CR1]|uniref:flavin reductase family protein n=1 Tax=Hahella sp. CR1 TaxID=2992807 RepID=UPI0024426D2D|nr:flavin reductase [Hahella sp. CR1]MDG9666319.1 flavin reductase [Hahella sp. CR1]